MKYSVKVNNEKTHDSIMSNWKSEIVILVQIWDLLSFCNISREGSLIYLIFYNYYMVYIIRIVLIVNNIVWITKKSYQ